MEAIQSYGSNGEPQTLSGYLQSVALMTDADMDEEDPDRVTLMTLHASKGLEFQVVFIAGLEEGLLPLIRGEFIEEADLEEERRLMYVGITRAKSRLYLGMAKVRSRYGGAPKFQEPSRFIKEIDPRVRKTSFTDTETIQGQGDQVIQLPKRTRHIPVLQVRIPGKIDFELSTRIHLRIR